MTRFRKYTFSDKIIGLGRDLIKMTKSIFLLIIILILACNPLSWTFLRTICQRVKGQRSKLTPFMNSGGTYKHMDSRTDNRVSTKGCLFSPLDLTVFYTSAICEICIFIFGALHTESYHRIEINQSGY